MEAQRFDQETGHASVLSPSRRLRVVGLLAGLIAAVIPGSGLDAARRDKRTRHKAKKSQHAHDEGKKKRKKKKKTPAQTKVSLPPGPAPTCMTVGQSCAGNCCSGLRCDTVAWCGPATDPHGPTCYASAGGSCTNACDCHADLLCSERQGHTCQGCAGLQAPCVSSEECCLTSSTCASNGCEEVPNQVCCQGLGASCFDSCDCCADLDCDEELNTCVPLTTPE